VQGARAPNKVGDQAARHCERVSVLIIDGGVSQSKSEVVVMS
jgi:hypothetical protein